MRKIPALSVTPGHSPVAPHPPPYHWGRGPENARRMTIHASTSLREDNTWKFLRPRHVFSSICVMLYTTKISKMVLLIGRRAWSVNVAELLWTKAATAQDTIVLRQSRKSAHHSFEDFKMWPDLTSLRAPYLSLLHERG